MLTLINARDAYRDSGYTTKDGEIIWSRIGIKLEFNDGVIAFYSDRFGTVSVTYPGQVATYRSGTPIHDLKNGVVYEPDRKNKGIPLEKLAEHYGHVFLGFVAEGIATTLARRIR